MGKLEKIVKELKELESGLDIKENGDKQRLHDVIDQIVEAIVEDLSHNINFCLWKKYYEEFLNLDYDMELKRQFKIALINANVFCKNSVEEEELINLRSILKKEKTLSKVLGN